MKSSPCPAAGIRVRKSARRILARSIAAAAVVAAVPQGAHAATDIWNGTTDALWDTGTNWSLGLEPDSTNDVLFPTPIPGTGGTITLTPGELANSLQFSDAYTLTGGDLTLTAGSGGNITVDPAVTATINSALLGTAGLTKLGTGTLILGGANTYSGVTAINAGTLSISADNNLGTAPGAATAGSLVIAGGTLATSGTFTLAANRGISLGTGGGTISTAAGTTLTYGGILAGTGALTKSGAGALVLSGVNTFSGGITLSGGGTLTYGLDSNLGAAANGINFVGGTLNFTGAAYTFTRALTVATGNSGTLQTPGTGATTTVGKLTISSAQLTGGGTFTKLGAGDVQFTVAQSFTGTFIVGGGIELSVANAFGSGTAAIQLQNGGELAVSANQADPITVTTNGTGAAPIISSIGNGTTSLTGPITVNGPLSVALRGFNNLANGFNLTLSGALSGSGNITVSGATVPNQTLFLSGNNSAYAGTLAALAGTSISFSAANSVPAAVTINSSAAALGGIGFGYDFGAAVPAFTNTRTGTSTGGVFEVNTTLAATTTLNLATLGGGGMFLGAQGTGVYAAATLGADSGIYRLGGGGGTLTLSATNVLTGANALVVGDARTNGGGTVILSAANDYTGTTTINAGATLSITNPLALGSSAAGTTVSANGALQLSNNIAILGESLALTAVATGGANQAGLISASGNNVFAGPIAANNDATNNVRITSNTLGATLLLAGNVTLNNAATGINLQGAGNITQTGVLSGPGTLFTTTAGILTLAGANTFTGPLSFQSGRVIATSLNRVVGGTASSSLGTPTTAAQGLIQLGTTTATGDLTYQGTGETTDRQLALIGTTGGGILEQYGTGLLKFTSNVSVPGAASQDERKTFTLGGSTAGTGEISGIIPNATTGTAGQLTTSLSKVGTGTWTLDGADTYTGTTTVGGGNLILDFSATTAPGANAANGTNIINATSPLAFSGGILTVNGSTGAFADSQTFAGTAVNAGGGTVAVNAGGSTGTVVNLGAITRVLGGTLNVIQPSGVISTTNGVTTTTATNATTGILGGYATVGGVDWAVGTATAGTPAAITAYTGYTALTTTGGGTQASTNFLFTSAANTTNTLSAPVTANTLKLTDTGTSTTAALANGGNAITLNSASTGGLLYVPAASGNIYTISGTGIVGAGAANEFLVNVATGGNLTISAPIIGAGAGALTKAGAGTLTLTNATSAFTGDIYVNGGTLAAGNFSGAAASVLGGQNGTTFRRMFLNGGTFNSTVTTNDNTPSATNVGIAFVIGSGGGTFNVNSGVTLTVDDGSGAGTASTNAELQGSGDLFKTGPGILSLGTASSNFTAFTGRIFVNAGSVYLGGTNVNFGDLLNPTAVASGAVVDLRGNTIAEPFILNGTGLTGTPVGALVNNNTGTSTASGQITLASNAAVGGSANLTLSGPVLGAFSLTKLGTGQTTLSGYNVYTGGTVVSAGILQAARTYALPGFATPGQVTVASGATLALSVGGLNEFAGMDVTALLNSGAFASGSSIGFDTTNAVGGTFSAPAITPAPTIAALNLVKLGTGTLALAQAPNAFGTGSTTIFNGTISVTSGTNNTLSTGPLILGSVGGTDNALNLGSTSQTFSTLTVNDSSATTASTITVASGKTLAFTGNVVIGPAAPASTLLSKLTIGGGGALTVNTAAGGLFQVGGSTTATTATAGDNALLDLTGLVSATINVSATGTVRINNPQGGNTAGVQASLLLPTPAVAAGTAVTTITTGNFNIGDNGGNNGAAGQINSAILGTGLTTLNANTVNIGTGGRDFGSLTFAAGNGTLKLRAADTTSRAAINVGTGGANTGVAAGSGLAGNTVDLTGHSADLLVNTLTIGSQSRNTDRTDVFAFDTGTLDATTVVVGTNSGTASTAANNTVNSLLNLGGGTVTIGAGGLDVGSTAAAVTGTDVLNASVNISGGAVTVANNAAFGAAIRLAQNTVATGLTTNGTLSISGGSLTVNGNIIKGSSTGAGTAIINLTGGTLDMTGKNIGTATQLITTNFEKGTLQNIAQVNGPGTAISPTTLAGETLIFAGTNTFTGALNLTAGTARAGSVTAFGNNSAVTVGASATLDLNGNNNSVGSLAGTGAVLLGSANLTTGLNDTDTSFGGTIAGSGGLVKQGAGVQTVTSSVAYTGPTTVSGGTLAVSGSLNATSSVTVNNSGSLLLNGSNQVHNDGPAGNNPNPGGVALTLGTSAAVGVGYAYATNSAAGAGPSNTFSSLTLSANSTVDFGTGAGTTFTFTDTSNLDIANGFSLALQHYSAGASSYNPGAPGTGTENGNFDRFLTSTALTDSQLAGISFYNDSGTLFQTGGHEISYNGGYEIVPIPEPSTLYSALLAVGLVGLRERRRFRRLLTSRP